MILKLALVHPLHVSARCGRARARHASGLIYMYPTSKVTTRTRETLLTCRRSFLGARRSLDAATARRMRGTKRAATDMYEPVDGGANEKVAILDAGAQFGKVIDRRVRELRVECDLLPLDTPAAKLGEYAALIISGGPQSVYDAAAPKYDAEIFTLGVPVLGICYGMQLMNFANGGTVESASEKGRREDGAFDITMSQGCALFAGLGETTEVLLTHGDSLGKLGDGFSVAARSGELIAAIECAQRKLYGVQFHPEVDLSRDGVAMFRNFLYGVCGLSGSYSMESRQQAAIDYIQQSVGDKKVLVLVSGGVDSSVCAALLNKAIGPERIIALHIDHGFMRHEESANVAKALRALGVPIDVLDATDDFAKATTDVGGRQTGELSAVTSPEDKRKIIGDTFMRVTQAMVARRGLTADEVYLAQGTLRPDLIESASELISSNAQVIKTHHNDTQLVRQLRDAGRIIEPLRDYHKDEVRELGAELGLPPPLVWRQPFPGPGLAIRVLCADKPYITDGYATSASQLEAACAAYPHLKLKPALLPVRTVGVQGDGRSYSYLAALSSECAEPDWPAIFKLAKEIPCSVHHVNRVVFVLGEPIAEPPREITPTTLTRDVLDTLRQADHIAHEVLDKHDGLMRKLSQMPVTMYPVGFGTPGARSIGIRAFITRDFMTGTPAMPGRDLPLDSVREIHERILKEVPGIARVSLDISPKPPATTEWE